MPVWRIGYITAIGVCLFFAAQRTLTPPQVAATQSEAPKTREVCGVAAPSGAWDPFARFLSGISDSSFSSAMAEDQKAAWTSYSDASKAGWQVVNKRFMARIGSWRQRSLASEASPVAFYPFSGPDAANVLTFFPNAREYVLIGLEPVGCLPSGIEDYNTAYFSDLRRSLDAVLSVNFFRTNDMSHDLREASVSGVLPLLLFLVTRSGFTVIDVAPITITAEGNVLRIAGPVKGETAGVALRFTDQSGEMRTLRYFSLNLQNSRLNRKPGTVKYLSQLPPSDTLIKSASYLMHKSYFSTIRNTILTKSRVIVEDDSGIPFRYFDESAWDVQLYGAYTEPIQMFNHWRQDDLKLAFESRTDIQPLNFAMGYRHIGESNLLVATRRQSN